MALTDAQIALLNRSRRQVTPTWYNSDTDESETISGDTEDALILLSSNTKQKAAQYIDQLLSANPADTPQNKLIAAFSAHKVTIAVQQSSEMDSVLSAFDAFRRDLVGGGAEDTLFTEGMQPLLTSILRGLGLLKSRTDDLDFAQRLAEAAEFNYTGRITSDVQKEWRSWKRVLLAYP